METSKMKIVNVPVAEIVPYENNPRINEGAVEQLANIIATLGFRNPAVLNKDKVIIEGHTRLLAVKKLDDDLVFVEDGGIPEAEGGDYVRQLLDRALVDARVVFVGNDLRDGDVHDLHLIRFHVCSPVRVSGFAGISSGRS